MKKFAKMSLIAAVAVAGMTTANAKDLTEAIKDVDVSGTVTYRYNDYERNDVSNNYKIGMNVSSKVNDDVKANTRFLVQSFGMNASKTGDANVNVKLSEVNFTYTGVKGLAVTVGKQAINTAFTVARDSIGTEATGTGAVASYAMGPVNVFAAYFNQNNFADATDGQNDTGLTFDGSEDVIATGVSASFGGVNVDASYVDVADMFDAYTVGVDAGYNISAVKLSSYARYSALDLDNSDADNSLWKVGVKANVGMFGAYLAYGATDKEGGVVGMDGSSTTGFDEHWNIALSGIADSDMLFAAVDAQVTEKLNVALKYSDLDAGSNSGEVDANEIYLQTAYKMSKNLLTYVRFGQLEQDGQEDQTRGRLHVQYSF